MRRLLVGTALAGVLATAGCSATGQEAAAPERAQVVSPPVASAPVHLRAERPDHLALGDIDAPVVPVDLVGGTLTPPDDPEVLGWWGKPVGSAKGVTLLVGHTVHTGGGDLDDLEDVRTGTVANVDGHRYRVTSNEVISKKALARRAARLFSQSGDPRLVVVTCEDYDSSTGHYRSNVVLVATPIREGTR